MTPFIRFLRYILRFVARYLVRTRRILTFWPLRACLPLPSKDPKTQNLREENRDPEATNEPGTCLPSRLPTDAYLGIAESRDPGRIAFPTPQHLRPDDLQLAEEGTSGYPGGSSQNQALEEKPQDSAEDVDQPTVEPGSAFDLYLDQRKGELIV